MTAMAIMATVIALVEVRNIISSRILTARASFEARV
jgi:hypothetical protein